MSITGLTISAGLVLFGVVALATSRTAKDPGTWHERDDGSSNLFWFVDEPVGDVYHVLFYDDFTGPAICDDDNGPMLWSGFATASAEENTIEGTFGRYWCPATSEREALEYPNPMGIVPEVVVFAIVYFPESDTITGSLFGTGDCVGSRQPHIKSVAKAIQELDKGMFPPSGVEVDIGCDG